MVNKKEFEGYICEIYDVGGAVRRMIEFIAGVFIGSVAGVAVMSLCAAAKERDEL